MVKVIIRMIIKQEGVYLIISQKLHNNYEIDWYLQAELAYNKRFGERGMKYPKEAQKEHVKKYDFTLL